MRHRIILEYKNDQWEWEIQRFHPMIGDHGLTEWEDVPGDDFAGQHDEYDIACHDAKIALGVASG